MANLKNSLLEAWVLCLVCSSQLTTLPSKLMDLSTDLCTSLFAGKVGGLIRLGQL